MDLTAVDCNGRIGDICITQRLSTSGAGIVFAGRHEKLGRDVAVKVIPKEIARKNPALVESLVRDTKVASRLTHPNIVRVYYAGDTIDSHYVVMDLVKGISLEELVRTNGHLSPQRVAQIGHQTVTALNYAYSHYGITHGDIKPAHLIIDGDGVVKIIDLGFSTPSDMGAWVNRANSEDQSVSLNFIAPERFKADTTPDCGGDIYSLGASLYYALSGLRPFGDGDPAETVKRIAGGTRQPLSEVAHSVPQKLIDAIENMMAADPAKRPGNYLAVARSLILPEERTSSDDDTKIIAGDGVPKKNSAHPLVKSPDTLNDALENLAGIKMSAAARTLQRHRPPTEQILMGPKVKETGTFKRYRRVALVTLGAFLFLMGFAAAVATLLLLGFRPV